MHLHWIWKTFNELSPHELYAMWHLRETVFIVEQNEVYLDADGQDIHSWHLLGYSPSNELIAYARVILPHQENDSIHFGRVIVKHEYRGKGLARQMVKTILDKIAQSAYKHHSIEISAQAHLEKFYSDFGFRPFGNMYYEGKIPHIAMLLSR
jgi:ElaA protein